MLRRAAIRCSSAAVEAVRRAPDGVFVRSPQFKIPSRHFLDFHKMGNKEAIEKERARISDELNRGYFADISEMRKNGGKVAMSNNCIIPSMDAVKFPDLEVDFSDGRRLKLPTSYGQKATDTSDLLVPSSSLLCLSFRASSQKMIESWSVPFMDSFGASGEVQVYEILFVDSWLLSRNPIKRLYLKMMMNSNNLQKHIVYSFGDHYDFRKKLKILNLLTGYMFLIDRFGRIRWQGYGFATPEELPSLLACTSHLLSEK